MTMEALNCGWQWCPCPREPLHSEHGGYKSSRLLSDAVAIHEFVQQRSLALHTSWPLTPEQKHRVTSGWWH